jgi:hypothetical protein
MVQVFKGKWITKYVFINILSGQQINHEYLMKLLHIPYINSIHFLGYS